MTSIFKSLFISILVIGLYICFDLITQFIFYPNFNELILFTSFIPTTVNFYSSDKEPINKKSDSKVSFPTEYEVCEDYLLDKLNGQFKNSQVCSRIRGISTFTRAYINPSKERELISMDNKGYSGIYCWYNKINSKKYIGSAIKLTARINDYFQIVYHRDKANIPIVRALKKYGMDSFILYVIEYVEPDNLLIISLILGLCFRTHFNNMSAK
jgi:hypothetical protein